MDVLNQWYDIIKAFHVISVIAWMAGMFYLPRLYAYHAQVAADSEVARTFEVMERRLLRLIINPAMIATWTFGGLMLATPGHVDWSQGWIYVKLVAVTIMGAVHGLFATWRKDFAQRRNRHSPRFYRIMNEVPTVLVIVIVVMVIVKPF